MKVVLGARQVTAHDEAICGATWCQGELLTASLDGSMKIWDVVSNSNSISAKFATHKQKIGATSIAAVQDGSTAVVCYQNGSIKFFDIINKEESGEGINAGMLDAWSVCLSPGDDVLASGNRKGEVHVWSMQPGHEKLTTLQTHNKFILSAQFSIDGKLAVASMDGFVNVFDMETQQIVHKIEAHAQPIRSIVFSPAGDLLYSASDDRHVSVFDVKSGQNITSFSHGGIALSVDASSDLRHFIVGSADKAVSVWDLGMQRLEQKLEGIHTDKVTAVSYDRTDATGKRFSSVGDDATIQLYH